MVTILLWFTQTHLTEAEKEQLLRLQQVDAEVYRHFAQRFEREVEKFGRERMRRSVEELGRINNHVGAHYVCAYTI